MSIESEVLVEAFCRQRKIPDNPDNRFGSPSLRVEGVSDGVQGVQWNVWVEWNNNDQMAFAGVNLEGMKYDGWPVGRLIVGAHVKPRKSGPTSITTTQAS